MTKQQPLALQNKMNMEVQKTAVPPWPIEAGSKNKSIPTEVHIKMQNFTAKINRFSITLTNFPSLQQLCSGGVLYNSLTEFIPRLKVMHNKGSGDFFEWKLQAVCFTQSMLKILVFYHSKSVHSKRAGERWEASNVYRVRNTHRTPYDFPLGFGFTMYINHTDLLSQLSTLSDTKNRQKPNN